MYHEAQWCVTTQSSTFIAITPVKKERKKKKIRGILLKATAPTKKSIVNSNSEQCSTVGFLLKQCLIERNNSFNSN